MSRKQISLRQPIIVYLLPDEIQRLNDGLANSPCRSMSEYCGLLLTRKAVPQYYRNKSFDEFMGEAILLRKELQTLREKMPHGTIDEKRLIMLIEQIKETINRIADICLH